MSNGLEGTPVSNAKALAIARLQKKSIFGIILKFYKIIYAIYVKANLYKASLYKANLYKANLYEANLYEANLYEANLDVACGVFRTRLSRVGRCCAKKVENLDGHRYGIGHYPRHSYARRSACHQILT